MNTQPNLQTMAHDLLEEKGLVHGLDASIVKEMEQDLVERMESQIRSMILLSLPAERTQAFETLITSSDPEKTQTFLEEVIPGLAEKIAEVLVQFRVRYLQA